MATDKLNITLVKSKYRRKKGHLECITGLGLKRINHTVTREDTPCIRGMISKINYLLKVEEA
jgi:large subunit ribosomal protein L30